jgi:hypothetical protein
LWAASKEIESQKEESPMRRKRLAIIISSVLAIAALMSDQVRAVEFSPSEIETLTSGKVVRKPLPNSRKDGFYGGAGFAIIDAPVEVVWKALEDWDAYPKIFPRTVDVKEVSRKGDRSLIRFLIGYKILSIKYHVTVSRDWEKKTVSFELAKNQAQDINKTRGYWKLLPQPDGRTLVAYAVALQVPAGIVTFLGDKMERSLEKSVIGLPKYLKKYIEKKAGDRYSKMTARAR